ncbi:MAG: nucleotidyltransferase domain-containing protein [Candidatus Hydrogenedentota bacterium]
MAKTKAQIKKSIKKYYKLIKDKYNIKYIILYGSYANGHPGEYSDIDLALISDDFFKDYAETLYTLSTACRKADIDIEPIVFSVKEFERPESASFIFEIKKTGKIVFKYPDFVF